jgi:virginiamycin B lyase
MSATVPAAVVPASSRRWGWWVAICLLAAIATAVVWRTMARPAGTFVEYPMLEPKDIPTAIAIAPDGTAWFTIDFADAIGRVRGGRVERLKKMKLNLEPIGIAVAADGAAWYTDSESKQVSRMAPNGQVTSIGLETPIVRLGRIAIAPDGAVWFADATAYGFTRLKDGKLERHVVESVRGGPYGVAVAADGTVWGTLQSGNQLVRIAPDGSMTAIDVPTRGSGPADVALDSAGGVWFIEFRGNKIGRFYRDRFEEIPVSVENSGLSGLAVAPDGGVWFGMLRKGSLGRIEHGKITEYKLPREKALPYSVAVDQDGNVWYTDITGYVGMLRADSLR